VCQVEQPKLKELRTVHVDLENNNELKNNLWLNIPLKQMKPCFYYRMGTHHSVSSYLPFILVLLVVFAAWWWDKSASDNGVSVGEEMSLPSLLCLHSNNLFTVMMGILWLFEGME
jgi:hypothetical protein